MHGAHRPWQCTVWLIALADSDVELYVLKLSVIVDQICTQHLEVRSADQLSTVSRSSSARSSRRSTYSYVYELEHRPRPTPPDTQRRDLIVSSRENTDGTIASLLQLGRTS